MQTIIGVIQTHPTITALVLYAVFSNAVSALPMPQPTDGGFYKWFFVFIQGIASNVSRAAASRGITLPSAPDPVAPADLKQVGAANKP